MNLESIILNRNASHKPPYIVLFYLYKMSRIGTFRDRTQTGGCRGLGVERRGEFGGEENVLYFGCGGGSVSIRVYKDSEGPVCKLYLSNTHFYMKL